ncbi:hypothetical protein HMPREF9946_01038 [Acetobacteraceae bacterium AT-5844]|nr:hypothetical protein HMPREF9946_01038 [Acetobacteraceae bacterium AT-5844]
MSSPREEIEASEAALRAAMLTADANALDRLLADDLIFTTQTADILDKASDVEAYRSGRLKLTRADYSDRAIRFASADTAIVTLRAELVGHFEGTAFVGAYRYTRVWRRGDKGWQVLAAHCSGVS